MPALNKFEQTVTEKSCAQDYPLTLLLLKYFCNTSSEGGCCNPLNFLFGTPDTPIFVTNNRYGPLLSIDTKMSTIELHMTLLWRHKVSVSSEIWIDWKYTWKLAKINFSLKNRRNMEFVVGLLAEYVRKWWFSSTYQVWSTYLVKYLRNGQIKITGFHQTPF